MTLKRFWLVVRLALGFTLLVLAIRQIDWHTVGSALSQVSAGWLALAFLAFLVTQALKILRWGWLSKIKITSWILPLSASFFIGQAANILLPVRGGEIIRLAWLAGNSSNKPSVAIPAGAALVMEKYLDLIALLILLLLLLPILPIDLLTRSKQWLLPIGIFSTIILLAGLWLVPAAWIALKPWITARVKWNTARIETWIEQLSGMVAMRTLLPSIAATFVIWGIMWLTNLLVLRALHLPLTALGAALSLALIYAGLIPAVMPGNFGPFYFFAMLGLAPFGITPDGQAAFAVLLHALVTLPPLLIAGGFLLAPRRGRQGTP